MTQSGFNPPKQPLQAVADQPTWKGASPNKLSSTSRILIGLARAQHNVSPSIPDENPALKQMAILENAAAELSTSRSTQLDKTLANINVNIEKIGSAATRPAIQLQSQFTQRTATLRAGLQTVARQQEGFKEKVDETIQLKNKNFAKISQALAENKEPNKNLLTEVTTKFDTLSTHSKDLNKEEMRVNEELKILDRETKQTAVAITGEEAATRLGPEKSAPG